MFTRLRSRETEELGGGKKKKKFIAIPNSTTHPYREGAPARSIQDVVSQLLL